jgi:uncharacterized protein
MRDGPWRRGVKALARWRYAADLAVTRRLRAARGETEPYELHGACTACGACCESPAIQVWPPLLRLRSARLVLRLWHRWVNGFEQIGMDRKHGVLIFHCTHYDPQSKRCDSYESRPGMCRDYPVNLLDEPRPQFLPPCTLYALHRDHDQRRAELDELELSPEKRRKVEREFYVWRPAPGEAVSHPQTEPPPPAPARRSA